MISDFNIKRIEKCQDIFINICISHDDPVRMDGKQIGYKTKCFAVWYIERMVFDQLPAYLLFVLCKMRNFQPACTAKMGTELYFIEKLKDSGKYSNIGTYWEKANRNEIDIVAVNDDEKKMLIAEVKFNSRKIDVVYLEEKAQKLLQKQKGYEVEFVGYSMKDMAEE